MSPKTIVMIDDEPFVIEMMSSFLKVRTDFQVYTALNGEDGWMAIEREQPDLITVDLMLPDIDGFEIIRRVRERVETKKTPIIVISARTDAESVTQALEAGADDYLTKPFHWVDFFSSIQRFTAPAPETNIDSPKARPTILCTISDDGRRQAVTALLGEDGYHVLAASDGLDALRILRERGDNPPDLIVVEYDMPGLDGPEIIRAARTSEVWSRIPFVLLDHSDQIEARGRATGAESVLRLPGPVDGLRAVISRLLTRRQLETVFPTVVERDLKILVIEDDIGLRNGLADILRYEGYEVVVAQDGCEGLDILKQTQPGLVLCDIMMPCLDGWGVLRKMRKMEALASTPFIFLTAKGETSDILQGWERGADEYIVKPFDPRDLFLTVRAAFERQAMLSHPSPWVLVRDWARLRATQCQHEFAAQIAAQNPDLHDILGELTLLSGGAIHDLRNVIGLVTTNARYLERQETKLPDPDTAHVINTRARRVEFLVEDLAQLRYRFAWDPKDYFPDDECVLDEVESLSALKYPNMTLEFRANRGGLHFFDRRQVQQGLLNLVDLLADLGASRRITISEQGVSGWENGLTFTLETAVDPELDPASFTELAACVRGDANALRYLIARMLFGLQGADLAPNIQDGRLRIKATLPKNVFPLGALAHTIHTLEQALADATEPPIREGKIDVSPVLWPPCAAILEMLGDLTHDVRQLDRALADTRFAAKTQTILRSLNFARLLVRNLVTAGMGFELAADPRSFPLRQAVDTVLDILSSKTLLKVSVEMPGDLPQVRAGELETMQILLNLVLNALEACGTQGTLTIRAAAIERSVRLEVADTGPGIPPETLERIFDLHYSTKAGHQRGTGLYVVRSIVDRLGASLEVESRLGGGTTFRITFPVAETG